MRTDTIAAIATAMSSSGIGIIRISGDEAVGIVDRIFSMKNGKKLSDMPTHTIHYGHIKDGDEVIDEVMVVLMRAPKSYTKEDTVEIDCHGGVYVMKRVLETVIKYGCLLYTYFLKYSLGSSVPMEPVYIKCCPRRRKLRAGESRYQKKYHGYHAHV